jgi:hypothetical protein
MANQTNDIASLFELEDNVDYLLTTQEELIMEDDQFGHLRAPKEKEIEVNGKRFVPRFTAFMYDVVKLKKHGVPLDYYKILSALDQLVYPEDKNLEESIHQLICRLHTPGERTGPEYRAIVLDTLKALGFITPILTRVCNVQIDNWLQGRHPSNCNYPESLGNP